MTQVQCSNCDGYRVEVTVHTRTERINVLWYVLMGIVAGVFFSIWGANDPGTSLDERLAWGVVFGVSLFIVGIVFGVKKVPTGRSFSCRLCGYQWSGDVAGAGAVHVRPDLIARGAARLDEEAAAAAHTAMMAAEAQRRREARR